MATAVRSTSFQEEECTRRYKFYDRRFPDVPMMSSKELIERQERDDASKLVLVDVRTQPERQVSMIPGAIALDEFEATLETTESPVTVITYCTIGYRSGFEARRLRQKYSIPQVYSLDGILAYTHAPSSSLIQIDAKTMESVPTSRVHTFGFIWKNCANPDYEISMYGFPSFLGRMMQVGVVSVVRTTQHLVYRVGSYCSCFRDRNEKPH